MNEKLHESLVNIFMAVADACDGSFDEADIAEIRRIYAEEFAKPEVRQLYSDLIDSNPFNGLI